MQRNILKCRSTWHASTLESDNVFSLRSSKNIWNRFSHILQHFSFDKHKEVTVNKFKERGGVLRKAFWLDVQYVIIQHLTFSGLVVLPVSWYISSPERDYIWF